MFKKSSNFLIKVFPLMMMMSVMFFSSVVSAQQLPLQQSLQSQEYSDEELVVFINAAKKVMPLQQESQVKMMEEIEEQNLTVEKFNSIMDARSSGADVEASQSELTAFNKAIEAIQDIHVEYEKIISETIEEEGISLQKYDEIITNYQQDTELQMRVNTIMEDLVD